MSILFLGPSLISGLISSRGRRLGALRKIGQMAPSWPRRRSGIRRLSDLEQASARSEIVLIGAQPRSRAFGLRQMATNPWPSGEAVSAAKVTVRLSYEVGESTGWDRCVEVGSGPPTCGAAPLVLEGVRQQTAAVTDKGTGARLARGEMAYRRRASHRRVRSPTSAARFVGGAHVVGVRAVEDLTVEVPGVHSSTHSHAVPRAESGGNARMLVSITVSTRSTWMLLVRSVGGVVSRQRNHGDQLILRA
jgi:hypothetical protein